MRRLAIVIVPLLILVLVIGAVGCGGGNPDSRLILIYKTANGCGFELTVKQMFDPWVPTVDEFPFEAEDHKFVVVKLLLRKPGEQLKEWQWETTFDFYLVDQNQLQHKHAGLGFQPVQPGYPELDFENDTIGGWLTF